jgi:hypothetical protein
MKGAVAVCLMLRSRTSRDLAPHDVGGRCAGGLRRGVFPAGTVFLAVVDPGVGTSRRASRQTEVDASSPL